MVAENEKNHKQDNETFQVVDRRRFTEEGQRRPGVESAPQPPPEAPPPEPPRASQAQAAGAQAPRPQESEAGRAARQAYDRTRSPRDYKVDFEALVMSLSTSAMYQLGLVEDPMHRGIPADLQAARHTIDLLGIIQEKTRGNLTPREAQLLEQVLYELRVAYVNVSAGKKPGAPKGA